MEPAPLNVMGFTPLRVINSVTANSPTMTKIGAIPSRRSGEPKVKRLTPDIGSVPMVDTIKPNVAAAKPFNSDLPVCDAISDRPRIPRPK